MSLRVTHAKLVKDFVVWVRFGDGSQGEVDLSNELDGPVFEMLEDPEVFAQVRLDSDTHTLVSGQVPPNWLGSFFADTGHRN